MTESITLWRLLRPGSWCPCWRSRILHCRCLSWRHFCAWFFRDPERLLPVGPVALSPGRREGGLRGGGRRPAYPDQHFPQYFRRPREPLARSPASSRTSLIKRASSWWQAARWPPPRTSRTSSRCEADDGTKVVFKQIAGLIARRIICYKKVGDFVQAGRTRRPHQVRFARGRDFRPGMARGSRSRHAGERRYRAFWRAGPANRNAAEALAASASRRRLSVRHRAEVGYQTARVRPGKKPPPRAAYALAHAVYRRQYFPRLSVDYPHHPGRR